MTAREAMHMEAAIKVAEELIERGEELLAGFEEIGLTVDCAYDRLYS